MNRRTSLKTMKKPIFVAGSVLFALIGSSVISGVSVWGAEYKPLYEPGWCVPRGICVHHARYVTFQLAEVAVPCRLYRAILDPIRRFATILPRAAPI